MPAPVERQVPNVTQVPAVCSFSIRTPICDMLQSKQPPMVWAAVRLVWFATRTGFFKEFLCDDPIVQALCELIRVPDPPKQAS